MLKSKLYENEASVALGGLATASHSVHFFLPLPGLSLALAAGP
jgi:hypothetical protein